MGSQVHIQGAVLIDIAVDKSGEPTQIRALEGHPLLISETMEAAKQWRFRPYRLDGKTVEMDMRIKVIFELKPRVGYRCKIDFPHRRRLRQGKPVVSSKERITMLWQ